MQLAVYRLKGRIFKRSNFSECKCLLCLRLINYANTSLTTLDFEIRFCFTNEYISLFVIQFVSSWNYLSWNYVSREENCLLSFLPAC
jgi:hypothetical protein